MPRDVTPADSDIERSAGPDLYRELTQTGAHPAREPDRNLAEHAGKVLLVEVVVEDFQPVKQCQVTGSGALATLPPRRGWHDLVYRERQKLALGCPAARAEAVG